MAVTQCQQEIDISITIQNTFVTLRRSQKEISDRRSSSVPRAFKPGHFCYIDSTLSAEESSGSSTCGESTSASDNEVHDNLANSSDNESQDFPDYCTDDEFDESDFVCSIAGNFGGMLPKAAAVPGPVDSSMGNKFTLTLDNMVSAEKKRSKLKSAARPFVSAMGPPAEVTTLIADAVRALSEGIDISEVQVHDGGMGGTTMIVAKSKSANPNGNMILTLAKDTLLNSAEQSASTYVLGYGAQPFNNLDPLSFSASVAFVQPSKQNTTCWDTYETGFCPRCSKCTWTHPSENDKMRIIVMVQKAA